jgi:hypothetical protein
MKSIIKTMRARRASLKDDCYDWSRIPREYNYIAIDAKDTGGWKAGFPIAYQREPHYDNGRWLRAYDESVDVRKDVPALVDGAAIIGTLPMPANSLRKRPGGA